MCVCECLRVCARVRGKDRGEKCITFPVLCNFYFISIEHIICEFQENSSKNDDMLVILSDVVGDFLSCPI